MTTIPDSVKAQLDSDWSGAGGAEPTYYVEEDIRTNPPTGQDYIFILSSTLDTDPVPFNDTFVNEKHVLELVTNTLTSEDRLKEIGDEVVRILNATAITDITYQRLKRRKITSGVDKGVFNYQEVITYDLQQQMKSSTASYGAGAGLQLDDLLMFGSAHAAYVPMAIMGSTIQTYWRFIDGRVINASSADFNLEFLLPLPSIKGSLKLYLKNLKYSVFIADANDYVDEVRISGINGNTRTDLDTDTTNITSNTDATFSGAVMPASVIDVSSYQNVIVKISAFVTDAAGLQYHNIRMECFYDT